MMRRFFCVAILLTLLFNACSETPHLVETAKLPGSIRFASYSMGKFSTEAAEHGDRIEKVKEVIRLLNADVIALQGVADRAVLELVFNTDDWIILIDDDSESEYDMALVIRKPLKVYGVEPDLDLDDEHFLYPGLSDNLYFPERRDVMMVEVGLPDDSEKFMVLNHSAVTRMSGRKITEMRRVMATNLILIKVARIESKKFIILGDFQDSPDDISVNTLEAGDRVTEAEKENRLGPYMANLFEPLYRKGYVTYGVLADKITGDFVNNLDYESRDRNFEAVNGNKDIGSYMGSMILVPKFFHERFVKDSAGVLNHEVTVRGSGKDVASISLPVFADFNLTQEEVK